VRPLAASLLALFLALFAAAAAPGTFAPRPALAAPQVIPDAQDDVVPIDDNGNPIGPARAGNGDIQAVSVERLADSHRVCVQRNNQVEGFSSGLQWIFTVPGDVELKDDEARVEAAVSATRAAFILAFWEVHAGVLAQEAPPGGTISVNPERVANSACVIIPVATGATHVLIRSFNRDKETSQVPEEMQRTLDQSANIPLPAAAPPAETPTPTLTPTDTPSPSPSPSPGPTQTPTPTNTPPEDAEPSRSPATSEPTEPEPAEDETTAPTTADGPGDGNTEAAGGDDEPEDDDRDDGDPGNDADEPAAGSDDQPGSGGGPNDPADSQPGADDGGGNVLLIALIAVAVVTVAGLGGAYLALHNRPWWRCPLVYPFVLAGAAIRRTPAATKAERDRDTTNQAGRPPAYVGDPVTGAPAAVDADPGVWDLSQYGADSSAPPTPASASGPTPATGQYQAGQDAGLDSLIGGSHRIGYVTNPVMDQMVGVDADTGAIVGGPSSWDLGHEPPDDSTKPVSPPSGDMAARINLVTFDALDPGRTPAPGPVYSSPPADAPASRSPFDAYTPVSTPAGTQPVATPPGARPGAGAGEPLPPPPSDIPPADRPARSLPSLDDPLPLPAVGPSNRSGRPRHADISPDIAPLPVPPDDVLPPEPPPSPFRFVNMPPPDRGPLPGWEFDNENQVWRLRTGPGGAPEPHLPAQPGDPLREVPAPGWEYGEDGRLRRSGEGPPGGAAEPGAAQPPAMSTVPTGPSSLGPLTMPAPEPPPPPVEEPPPGTPNTIREYWKQYEEDFGAWDDSLAQDDVYRAAYEYRERMTAIIEKQRTVDDARRALDALERWFRQEVGIDD
jgi:hypothetical protein